MTVLKKYLKLFVFPAMFILIFLIVKILLNVFNLEFMSWVYYVSVTIILVYCFIIINYVLFDQRKNKKKIDMFDIAGANLVMITVYGIMMLALGLTVGVSYKRENENFVHQDIIIGLWPNEYVYEYINFIIRGNEKIECRGETCV